MKIQSPLLQSGHGLTTAWCPPMPLSQSSSVTLPLGLERMDGEVEEVEGVLWFLFSKKGKAGMSPSAGLGQRVVF